MIRVVIALLLQFDNGFAILIGLLCLMSAPVTCWFAGHDWLCLVVCCLLFGLLIAVLVACLRWFGYCSW